MAKIHDQWRMNAGNPLTESLPPGLGPIGKPKTCYHRALTDCCNPPKDWRFPPKGGSCALIVRPIWVNLDNKIFVASSTDTVMPFLRKFLPIVPSWVSPGTHSIIPQKQTFPNNQRRVPLAHTRIHPVPLTSMMAKYLRTVAAEVAFCYQ